MRERERREMIRDRREVREEIVEMNENKVYPRTSLMFSNSIY
jgi:hypothetical protein